LTIAAQPSAAPGSTVALTLDPPSATLSNQSSSVVETVANGLLALTNGSVTLGGTIAAPSGVVATASGTALVNVTWNVVAGAESYQVWRSVDGSAFAPVASPSAPPYDDSEVAAGKAYVYRIRSVNSLGAASPLSNPDVATTVAFADDPVVATATTIRLVHFTQLRAAVNAFRVSASLAPLASDPTLAIGAVVRASHLAALRTGLNEAREAVGMAAVAFDTPTIVLASHVNQLRNGVK
jgi:fibronectin type 3 domain-containing protein